jgi:hypothetical protein
MRICIVGSGAREVAIARSLKASPKCSAVSPHSFPLSASLSVGPLPGSRQARARRCEDFPVRAQCALACRETTEAVPRRASVGGTGQGPGQGRGSPVSSWDKSLSIAPRQVLCFASTRNPALVVLPHPPLNPPYGRPPLPQRGFTVMHDAPLARRSSTRTPKWTYRVRFRRPICTRELPRSGNVPIQIGRRT